MTIYLYLDGTIRIEEGFGQVLRMYFTDQWGNIVRRILVEVDGRFLRDLIGLDKIQDLANWWYELICSSTGEA